MLTAAEARELAKKFRNLANRTGISPRRKNLLNGIARSYSALTNQFEMLQEAEKFQGNNSESGPNPDIGLGALRVRPAHFDLDHGQFGHSFSKQHDRITAMLALKAQPIPDTWYVTFETPKQALLSRKRRSPRMTKTFETEVEAKKFAREQFDKGLSVIAGTINPQFPKQTIPSSGISDWLENE